MMTFYEIEQSSPPTAEGLVNAAIGGGIILVVILVVMIVRIWKEGEK